MTDKPLSDQSQAEFERTLRDRFQAGQGKSPTTAHMTPAPTGKSRSLEEMLGDEDGEDLATTPVSVLEVAVGEAKRAGSSHNVRDRKIVFLRVARVVDSPYQPRTSYDETALQQLAVQMEQRGQDEPIRVRLMPDGEYQLIAGHRRIRAARLLGWAEIEAFVEKHDERSAAIATLISNESNVGLSDFDRGMAYQRALDDGLATSQEGVAKLFGCTQGRVSQCLSVVKLPSPIIALLRRYPGLINYRHAKVVKDVLAGYPDRMDAVVQAVESIIDRPDMEPLELQQLCLRSTKELARRASPAKPKFVPDRAGVAAFTVRSRGNQLVVAYHSSLKPEQVKSAEQHVLEALRKVAETFGNVQ